VFHEEGLKLAFKILGLPPYLLKSFYIIIERGEVTIKELAEHLGVSIRTVYNHISKLMSHGLLTRKPVEKDGRLVYVYSPVSMDEIKNMVKARVQEVFESG